MSFIGATLSLRVFSPDTRTPITEQLDFVPVAQDVEIQDLERYEIAGNVVNVDIDVEASSILISVDRSSGRYTNVPNDGFNGYVFFDSSNTLPTIQSVSLNPTSTIRLASDKIIFNKDAIFLNVDDLPFRRGDTIMIDVSFSTQDETVPDYVKQIARVYEAAFGREADNGGLNFWVSYYEDRGSIRDIAQLFITSAEFQALYSDPAADPGAFVQQMYRNVLGREGDAPGIAFWTDALITRQLTYADALARFSNSDENIANTTYLDDLARTAAGDWYVV